MRQTAYLLLLILAGCGSAAANVELPDGEPLVRGPVEELVHRGTFSGMLVSAAPGSIEPCGIQATVDADTRLLAVEESGEVHEIQVGEIAVGDTVDVYVDGAVLESCPVQGGASTVVLER